MLFRVKITKCIDIVIESNELNEVMDLVDKFSKTCRNAEKIFIHRLDRENNELIDRGIVYSKESMED